MSVDWQLFCMGCFRQKGPQAVCQHCGYDETAPRGPLLLPHRTRLHKHYLVGRVLGKPGGFGVTYLAFDTGLETLVAIKEYLPRELVGREAGRTTVSAHSPEEGGLFRFGLEQFVTEARTLAKFDHAHLVKVRQVFAENATAYLVMDYYEGMTLAEYLQQKNRLPAATALAILNPILDGLREVHEKGFIHRDIKPQNIYLTRQGRPILLDFGTARLAMAERSRSMSVVLSAGYAPFEQYSRRGGQGPWTDVYACAAILYFMLTGQTPAEAMDRVEDDTLILPQRLAPDLSERLAKVVVQGLATEAKQRYQTIRAFQEALLHAADTDASSQTKPKIQTQDKTPSDHMSATNQSHDTAPTRKPLLGIAILALIGIGFSYALSGGDSIGLADQKFFAHQYSEALPIYQRLAKKHNGLALFRLGSLYENGFGGVAMDTRKAAMLYQESANTGNPLGRYNVGRVYRDGVTWRKDPDKAWDWFRLATESGIKNTAERLVRADDPIMLFIAAQIAYGEKRYSQALAWYQSAAEQGYASAQVYLAMMYQEGEGVEKNEAEELKWCTASAEQGLALAQHCLGDIYALGKGVTQNYTEAAKWYRLAAEQGLADSKTILANMYKQGLGVDQNDTEAVNLFRQAAEQGNKFAQGFLGWMYHTGKGVDKSFTEAAYWYGLAAQQGNADAQVMLGDMYQAGTGVSQNYTEAERWYRLAAQQGNANAQVMLGDMYQAGTGVSQSDTEAEHWYRLAAQQGRANAQNSLGLIYWNIPDYPEAIKWFQKAAEQGEMMAQFNLGTMYYFGSGTDQNLAQAKYWYQKSAQQGYAPAIKTLKIFKH
jgi:TPR repeat protein